jgi:hypothetical protein
MHGHAARGLQRREHVGAHEQLAGLVDPVLAECRLQVVDHRPQDPDADVSHLLVVACVAKPDIDDAVPADVADAAVDDQQLAVIAAVDLADVAQPLAMEQRKAAAGLAQAPLRRLTHLLAAVGVDQHPNLEPGPPPLDQRVDQALPKRAFLPEEGFEMHRCLRLADVLEHRVEEGAVLEDLDRIAGDHRTMSQPGDRRHQVGDRILPLDREDRITMPLDRPQDQGEQQCADAEHDIQYRLQCHPTLLVQWRVGSAMNSPPRAGFGHGAVVPRLRRS